MPALMNWLSFRKENMQITGNILLPFILSLSLFSFPLFAWGSAEKDKYFFQVLTKDPNSEQNRYEYARYLYEEDKLDMAMTQVDLVLKLNSNNDKAKKLKGYIEEAKGISDPIIRRQKMLGYTMADLQQNVGEMKKATEELQRILPPAEVEKNQTQKAGRQKALNDKYRISQSLESCDPFDPVLMKYEVLAVKYRAKGMQDEAIKTYREAIQKKNAAGPHLGIVSILLGQNKFKEALDETERATPLFPKDVRFQIYKDGLQKIKSLLSSEEKQATKLAIIESMSDADEVLRSTCSLGKK